jgi:signal recognition particle subunit SRP54
VKNILIDADVNLQVANSLIKTVKERALGMKLDGNSKPGEQFISLLAQELVDTMGASQSPILRRSDGRPTVIMLLGLQGAGKTTAAAKLANYLLNTKHSEKIMLVAADVYRPAAIEQLQTLGAKIGVEVFTEPGANPVQIVRKAFAYAKENGVQTLVIDTAGRQVVDQKLMDELQQMKAAVLPDESLLVVDAMIGQEAATLTAKYVF